MTLLEVLQRIAEAKERGEKVDLRAQDLRGTDLSGVTLKRAYLSGADLKGAILIGANLHRSNLSGADLRGANLYGADLREANLEGVDLRGATLSVANLRRANLQHADLYGANLDFSCLPLSCGSLQMHIDERQAKQLLYHVLSLVNYSKHISEKTKRLLLTPEKVAYANQFHRVGEVPELQAIKESEVEE